MEIRTDMYSAGKWADVLCLKRQGYICQGYKGNSISVLIDSYTCGPVPLISYNCHTEG